MTSLIQGADTGEERLEILQKKRTGLLDGIHFREKKQEHPDLSESDMKIIREMDTKNSLILNIQSLEEVYRLRNIRFVQQGGQRICLWQINKRYGNERMGLKLRKIVREMHLEQAE